MRLYRRGIHQARRGNSQAAVDAYTAVIRIDAAPPSIRGMARFNRALALWSTGRHARAEQDMDALLAGQEVPPSVREAARDKLHRMRKLRAIRSHPRPTPPSLD